MKPLYCLQASGKEANGKHGINCFGALSQNMSYNGHMLGQWAVSGQSFCGCSNAFNHTSIYTPKTIRSNAFFTTSTSGSGTKHDPALYLTFK